MELSLLFFVILSLCYGFVGVILIAFYVEEYKVKNSSLLSFVFLSLHYRICFFILCVSSFATLLWQDMGVVYLILMFLLLLGIIDIKCLALPDMLNFLLLGICVAYAFLESVITQENFILRILLGFGIGGIFFTLKILYQSLSDKEIIGEADIIVLCSLGIAFGALSAFMSVFLGSICALIYALFLAIFLKQKLITLKLPFCFFVFLGTLLHMVYLGYEDFFYA